MWPLVVAGSVQPSRPPVARERFRHALNGLRDVCAFDLDRALGLLNSVWTRVDAGDAHATWRDGPLTSGSGVTLL